MASFTRDQVTKHLISLGVDPEHIKDEWHPHMLSIKVPLPPEDLSFGAPSYVRIDITIFGSVVEVKPEGTLDMGFTKYGDLNKYFDKRIKLGYSRMEGLAAKAKEVQDASKLREQELRDTYKDLFREGKDHISCWHSGGNSHIYLKWFGNSFHINPETEEVSLGYGEDRITVPITFAIEFLNQCKVYKLLEG